MTDRERFVAVARGEPCDYVPIFGHNDAPGVSAGCMRITYDRLRATGMPDVGGCWDLGGATPDLEGWYRYWGTTGPIGTGFFPAEPAPGIASERRVEGGFEVIEYETGARTRQVIDNDITYSMPDFQVYHVRDRASWRHFLDRTEPGQRWSADRIEAACRPLDSRTRPLEMHLGSTWGRVRESDGSRGRLHRALRRPGPGRRDRGARRPRAAHVPVPARRAPPARDPGGERRQLLPGRHAHQSPALSRAVHALVPRDRLGRARLRRAGGHGGLRWQRDGAGAPARRVRGERHPSLRGEGRATTSSPCAGGFRSSC